MFYIILSIFLIFVYVVYKWFKSKYQYWERKGIKYVEPIPVLGNFKPILFIEKSFASLMQGFYDDNKDEKVVGIYQGLQPALLVRDPELLRHIFIKDFPNFTNRLLTTRHSYLDDNLFNIEEEKWRILRQKLTPLFTSGKLKGMVPLIEHTINRFVDHVDKVSLNNESHELRSLIAKYTVEVIGSCAFGVEIDALNDNAPLFEEIGALIFRPNLPQRTWMGIDLILPQVLKIFNKFDYHPHVEKRIVSFFYNLTDKLLKERDGKPKMRHDFMDLMIELKEQGKVGRRDDDKVLDLEMDQMLIAAQAFVFYAAGFETSSSTMSFLLYELALNKQIQNRAYEEVIKVSEKYNGKVVFDSINDLQYLSMCFDETLRKYPIVGHLERVSANKYTFPGTKITIDGGTKVYVSNFGLHHDPKYYPNPDVYDPERFSPENKSKIPACAYLPFGEGPRNCIGLRFAKVSSMLLLANFLKKFKVTPLDISKEIKFSSRNLTLAVEGGLMVNISKRSN